MTEGHEIFSAGDLVVWQEQKNPQRIELLKDLKGAYGDGPFQVNRVRPSDNGMGRAHPQVLTVRLKKSTVLPFSGDWFTHADS